MDEKESILSQKQDQLAKVQEEKSSNASELQHLRDTSEVKDRKMNVLTKKATYFYSQKKTYFYY